ncbi:uncharacterized protein LOC111005168 [Momordica charantia]|uniref:Uncharacterized protein LOC111005168 n=1 Tax=Momordica charantia TaxID=3673 RepID=A0A6J1BVT2_MOMCH|nr:uncharacterized protein LOC111005168 [Momordica charantia]
MASPIQLLFSVVLVMGSPLNQFSLWVSLSSLFLSLFTFFFRALDGGKKLDMEMENSGDSRLPEEEEEEEEPAGGRPPISDEEESNDFVFSFKFRSYEEFSKTNREDFGSEGFNSLSNRYEFLPEKSTSFFVIPSFKVEVLNSCSSNQIPGTGDFPVEEFPGKIPESESIGEEITESSVYGGEEGFSGKVSEEEITQSSANGNEEFPGKVSEEEITECSANGKEEFSGKISESKPVEDEITEKQRKVEQRVEEEEEEEEEDFTGSDSDSDSGFDFHVGGYEPDEEINEEAERGGGGERTEESDELNGLETEWEHQELIEQLKMELKKVRARGLPTIFEESESPKIMEELKPWKIDDKFQHGDLMEELHKFYRTYRERMRKLDILNYQKMYAMGVLQSKDPLKSFCSNSKSSSPSITSLLSQNLRLYRQKKSQVDPMKNFIREVHCDLEMVYVGQMCLSWEFIQWQYEKALDLWESEPHGLHHYNEVAGEFQQFQVLLQRFLENEAFEGPRVENYVKHRCVARHLLQVPVIREDKMRDRRKARRVIDHENEAITSDMLVEILQESIRIIWQFIRSDKDQATLKRSKKFQVELQDPVDEQLLMEIQADLHKKERKLKEIVRSGHCILKRLQRNEEEETEGDLCFFCEVDMKLVGRVLRMSRITTDQLVWCRNKLSRINFLNRRKIRVEPSFFLFPC